MIKIRKLLSLFLCLIMVLSLFPAAYAEGEHGGTIAPVEETETPADPPAPEGQDENAGTISPAGLTEADEPSEGEGDDPDPGDGEDPVPPEVTRIQWISALVEAFSMTVEADNYPDNYYSDMSAEAPGYRDLMVAVEFGVVDLEAGLPFRPEEAATRDFAAQTLTYCLGFQETEETAYSFSDEVPHPWAAQVALNRGWFAAVEGAFLPDEAITALERDAMLADAAAILASDGIDPDHVNSNGFSDGVVVVPMGTEITNDEEGRLHIRAADAAIQPGTVFVIYYGDFPLAFAATEVETDGEWLIVTATTEGAEDAITDLDYAGSLSADLKRFVPAGASVQRAEDGELIYNSATVVEHGPQGISITKDSIKGNKDFTLGAGLKASVNYYIKDVRIDTVINEKDHICDVTIYSDATLDVSVKNSLSSAWEDVGSSTKVLLGYIPFFYTIGEIEYYFEYDLGGQIAMSVNGDLCVGFSYNDNDGFRLKLNFTKKQFSISANGTAKAGLRMDMGFDICVLKCSTYSSIGVQADLKYAEFETGNPQTCKDVEAYLYARVGASAKIFGIKEFHTPETQFISKPNSPIRVHYHWEDGVRVAECSRKEDFREETGGAPGGYYTGSGSRYYDPMSLHTSSTYINDKGNTVTLWTYTLDENNQATITAYKGSAAAVQVPETIDGYTVVAIGRQAFAYNTSIRSVMIADTVSLIDTEAFFRCSSLSTVSLSQNLETIYLCVFKECTALSSIELPESMNSIGDRSFEGCTSLETVVCGDSTAVFGDEVFSSCPALTTVVLPGRLSALGNQVFFGCYSLKEISLPATLQTCGGYGPLSGSSIERVYLEDGMLSIPANTLRDCKHIHEITIPESVTSIGENAFRGCEALTAVEIPDTVSSLGKLAFYECTSLETVKLPHQIETLPAGLFGGCSKLRAITIPKSVTTAETYIGQYDNPRECGVFEGCDDLRELRFEEGITSIPSTLFKNCTGIGELVIPSTVTTIESYAFYSASGLRRVTTGDVVATIGESAFADCINLESVVCGDAAASVGDRAFSGCTALTTLVLPGKLSSLGFSVFSGCNLLTEISIPKTLTSCSGGFKYFSIPYDYEYGSGPFTDSSIVTVVLEEGLPAIPDNMFTNCGHIAEIDLPQSVKTIGKGAFSNSPFLTSVTLPNELQSIDINAFAGCTALRSISVPDSVSSIGIAAFAGCTHLEDVRLSRNVSFLASATFYGCSNLKTIEIPKSITSVGTIYSSGWISSSYAGAFEGCDDLSELSFESGTTSIPSYLFYRCPGLGSLEIPNTVTEIKEYAFQYATGLKHLTIGRAVTTIGKNAFNESGLVELVIPSNVREVGNAAFSACPSLESLVLMGPKTSVDSFCFSDCSALMDVSLPEGLTVLGSYWFQNCSSLERLMVPESVTAINESCFSGCKALAEISLPSSLQTIGASAFNNCDSLTSVTIPEGTRTIGNSAYRNCDALTDVSIPDSVSSLGDYLFYHCDELANVHLGKGAAIIPQYSFYLCPKLEEIVIPRGVTTIQPYAFNSSTGLVKVTMPRTVSSIDVTSFSYPEWTVIYGIPGTYAETWANENGFTFVDAQTHADQVSLSETTLILNKGYSVFLPLTIDPAEVTDEVIWKVSNSTALKIVGGYTGVTVTGLDFGTGTLKVNVGTKGASCKITVVQPVTSLKLDKTTLAMDALETAQLTATVLPQDAYNSAVLWTSSDDAVAAVDENGLVTARAKGTAVITAAAADGSGKLASCSVTVRNTAYIAEDPETLESPHSYEDSCSDVWLYTVPGAEKLLVTFDERTQIEEDFDFLYLYDGEGNQIGVYTGSELAGQTVEIPGDTVKIRLVSDDSGSEWGFKISALEAVMAPPSYEIRYDANGGENAPESQTKIQDEELSLSEAQPTRQGETLGSITVTLDPNGGSVETDTLTSTQSQVFAFTGWNTAADGSGTEYAPGAVYTANEETTLYAQWAEGLEATPVLLPTPVRSGYTFLGWAESKNAVSGATDSYSPGGDVILHAIWQLDAGAAQARLVVGSGRAPKGSQIQIPVRLENNPGVISVEVQVRYDESALEWIGVSAGNYGGTFDGEVGGAITWYAEDPRYDVTADDVLFTLTFLVKEEAADGAAQVSLGYGEHDIFNAAEENQRFQVAAGEIVVLNYLPGDINGDGALDNKDVTRLIRYLKYKDVTINEAALDVNGDGLLNNKDVTRLIRYIKYGDVEIF